ncbi:MAG: hypothetical protein SO128_03430 [Clostridium cadaveris]|nr:hypothetical protein [Clostridium cadaveris]MDM8313317.1 hypothetical protein [Clostridium cadaveris]MDU4953988.1 hypothetical protein [Clostridium sp.]MDY4948410.1 hypothetical protein [Clostridium cadaveris]
MKISETESIGGRNLLIRNLLNPSLSIYGIKKHKRFIKTSNMMK